MELITILLINLAIAIMKIKINYLNQVNENNLTCTQQIKPIKHGVGIS